MRSRAYSLQSVTRLLLAAFLLQTQELPATLNVIPAASSETISFTSSILDDMTLERGSIFVAGGDINNDSNLDVVSASTNPILVIFLGKGLGSFKVPAFLSLPSEAPIVRQFRHVTMADLNGDGDLDLAVTSHDDIFGPNSQCLKGILVLLGNGDGTFGSPAKYVTCGATQATDQPSTIVTGDFTADGIVDLALRNRQSVSILPGFGDGTFGMQIDIILPTESFTVPTQALTTADLNGDGILDLAVAGGASLDNIVILLGHPNGLFLPPASIFIPPPPGRTSRSEPVSVESADFNGDAKLDLAVGLANSNGIAILLGNGDGTFGSSAYEAFGDNVISLATADFNQDGKSDVGLAALGVGVRVLPGNGDGTFAPALTIAEGPDFLARQVITRDVNNDQKPDLIASNFSFGVSIFLNTTITTLEISIDIKPGDFPNTIKLGSDGTVAVAILSTPTFDATTVDPLTVTLAGAQLRLKRDGTPKASFEDINGDGLLDLVVHVSTQALQLSQTDTEAVLEGQTLSGIPIRGTDSVRLVR